MEETNKTTDVPTNEKEEYEPFADADLDGPNPPPKELPVKQTGIVAGSVSPSEPASAAESLNPSTLIETVTISAEPPPMAQVSKSEADPAPEVPSAPEPVPEPEAQKLDRSLVELGDHVLQVRVTDPRVRAEAPKAVEFLLTFATSHPSLKHAPKEQIRVLSSFEWLYWKITTLYPSIAVPALPSIRLAGEERGALSNGLATFGSSAMRLTNLLDIWLHRITTHPFLCLESNVVSFMTSGTSEWNKRIVMDPAPSG